MRFKLKRGFVPGRARHPAKTSTAMRKGAVQVFPRSVCGFAC
jgi:hypothetical protein